MNKILFIVSSIFFLASCQMQSDYDKMVEKEMAKGIRQDSIFLGMTFGMTADSFYEHCKEMNRKGYFFNGPSNRSVQFDISDQLRHPGKIFFYPTFYEGKIYEMPASFAYDAFTWNDSYGVDSLMVDVLGLVEEWYGEFKEFKHPEKESVYVNVNANRRIRVYKNRNDNSVNAVFTDLSIDKEELEKAAQSPAEPSNKET